MADSDECSQGYWTSKTVPCQLVQLLWINVSFLQIKHRHCGPKESDTTEWLDWTELNYDPAIPLRGVYPRDTKTFVHKHLCKNAPNSFIYDDKHLFIFFLVVHWFLIACTGEPGGLPSMGSHRVGHDWIDLAATAGIIEQINKCCDPHGLHTPWNSPGQNTGVVSPSLLQGIFPTQVSPNCRRILYQLSHQGSPRILEWVAYPFSSRSSRPRNWTRVSCIAGRFFTNWAIRKAKQITDSGNIIGKNNSKAGG